MAAMGFNKRTATTMLSFVDENQGSFSEGEYIEICNALQFLHKKAKKAPSIPILNQSPVEELSSRLQVNEKLQDILSRYHNTLKTKGRIILQDKYTTLLKIRAALPQEYQDDAFTYWISPFQYSINRFTFFLEAINCIPDNIGQQFLLERDARMITVKREISEDLTRKAQEKQDNTNQINNLIVQLARIHVEHSNAIYKMDTDDEEDDFRIVKNDEHEIIDLTI
jgi:hypothetical protein